MDRDWAEALARESDGSRRVPKFHLENVAQLCELIERCGKGTIVVMWDHRHGEIGISMVEDIAVVACTPPEGAFTGQVAVRESMHLGDCIATLHDAFVRFREEMRRG